MKVLSPFSKLIDKAFNKNSYPPAIYFERDFSFNFLLTAYK